MIPSAPLISKHYCRRHCPLASTSEPFTIQLEDNDELTVFATSPALHLYRKANQLGEHYKVTIAVAGLSKSLARRYGHLCRLLGIKVRNVHGERTQSSPIIRLADTMAGLVREAIEGNNEYVLLKKQLRQKRLLTEI